MRRYQHIMAMLRTKRTWERRCIQCKHSIILCMSWLISRLRYLALLRNPTRLDFAMSEMKRAPTQALNFISSTPEKIAILVSKGKQEKIRSIYIHLHTLFCSLQLANGMPAVADPPSTSALATHFSCPPSEDFQSHRICVLRAATMRLYTNKTLPYHFGTDLMSRIKMKNALTFQGSSDGWPLLFAVESKVCKGQKRWYMWVNAQKPHAKPCIAYFLQTQVRPLNFVMKRSRKHCERFWDYPTGRFFCC